MKRGKLVQPKFPIEYRLLITPRYNEREKETLTFIAIRTVNEFTNFLYEIIVKESIKDREIRLAIQGLRAPRVSFPGTGPATFKKEFRDLHGTYGVIVTKLDREENVFVVDISREKVVLQKSPKKKFIDVVTSEEDW